MEYQFTLSGILLLVFAACVAVNSVMLRKRGVRAVVFGETDKSDYLLIVIVAACVFFFAAQSFLQPALGILYEPFWLSAIPGLIGLFISVIAIIILIRTLVSFGDSFRVGIDEKTPSKLVTEGMFAISRNPVYLCVLLIIAGLFLIHHNAVITAFAVVFPLMIHRQILREEKFLEAHYGEEYLAYKKKVRRYI